jgi:hypothetical protein
MIMLQRASEGEDKDLCEMCLATGIGADKCEAVCGNSEEENTSDEKVKSGDLAVTAEANNGKAILAVGTSDMDVLTFKTSEEVEITKITLERYGYSTKEDVATVSLEDDEGNVIAEGKALNTKDQVTLSIKKDYKELDATDTFAIVASISDTAKAGTLGFKVTAVDSSAKNLDLSDYDPYTYDMVEYKGTNVNVEVKGKDTQYNYTEGEYYEVARLKVSANSSNLLVN